MFVQVPRNPNGILVVLDQRLKSDRDLDEEQGGQHVAQLLSVGKHAAGHHWHRMTRLALYDYGQKPTPKERAAARKAYREFLALAQPRVIIVFPTPSKAMSQDATVSGTQVWRDLNPPDALDEMRGAFWQYGTSLVVPTFAPIGNVGQLNLAFTAQWIKAALHLVNNHKAGLLRPVTRYIDADSKMLALLQTLRGKPIAVDIETIPDKDVITAIGVSDLDTCVSVPFDGFEPACGSGPEAPLSDYAQGRAILAELRALLADPATTKILQNGVFDGPQLAARGLPLGGTIHDTLAMHAIAYPEARHGLQLATASQLIVPPWKSEFKPKNAPGVKKDDAAFWYWEARDLRTYNAHDAFYTRHLAEALAWKVGVKL